MAVPPSEEELVQLQKLSQEYQPSFEGLLVGPKQASTALTAEYAAADPVYVEKTTALPTKYAYYRTVRGDGKCGWRAVAFCYFETFMSLGDASAVQAEVKRLESTNALLIAAGYGDEVFLEFAQASIDLMKKLAINCTSSIPSTTVVQDYFNDIGDDADPNAVIAHFKYLTSAWMKSNPAKYADFIDGGDVAEYCKNLIEPFDTEIDNIGLMALTAAFLFPCGLALEVLYLDRSAGSEVNTHRFEAYDENGRPLNPDAPTISLLYRPGHYDILYKIEATNPIATLSAASKSA